MTVECLYSCHKCGLVDVAVEVPLRGPEEDVVHWVQETMGRALANDHATRSPHCVPETLSNVKIPLPPGDNAKVGGPTIN